LSLAVAAGLASLVFWFSMVGYIAAMAAKEARRTIGGAFWSAIKQGTILVLAIELTQIFSRVHSFDMTHVLVGGMSVVVGTWGALFLMGSRDQWQSNSIYNSNSNSNSNAQSHSRSQSQSHGHRSASLEWPTVLLVLVAWGGALFAVIRSLDASTMVSSGTDWALVHWVPFEHLWRLPVVTACQEALLVWVGFAVMAGALGIVLGRVRAERPWRTTALLVTVAAIGIELLHASHPAQIPDTTGPILAFSAVWVCSRMSRVTRTKLAVVTVQR
jgi:hypothetical protein